MPLEPTEELERRAADPSTAPEELRSILRQCPRIWHLIAQNPSTPADVLLNFQFESSAKYLLLNPIFPLLLFENPSLSGASQPVRCGLARLPETPAALLDAFADSGDISLLLALSQNARLSDDLARKIAHYTDENFRSSLARFYPIPELFHRYLLTDASQNVRYWASQAIGRCKHCSSWRALLHRALGIVEGRTSVRLTIWQQRELLSGGAWARVLLAQQPSLSNEIWFALSGDPSPQVQRVLRRKGQPPHGEVLKKYTTRQSSLRREPRCRQAEAVRKTLRGFEDEDEGAE